MGAGNGTGKDGPDGVQQEGTDGETPSLPESAGPLARISISGPQAAATPGRARVPRAIPTSPGYQLTPSASEP